nr:MAG TPA: hypothetical protein [Caudoviricetes sp.]DAY56944.1 MAG TPA: hypothetical protein [Caudoviricetes sp.]
MVESVGTFKFTLSTWLPPKNNLISVSKSPIPAFIIHYYSINMDIITILYLNLHHLI